MRQNSAQAQKKCTPQICAKSLISLHFVPCGAVKTQKLSGIGFAEVFDKTSNPCCAQFQAIAQRVGKGHAHLLRTTEKI